MNLYHLQTALQPAAAAVEDDDTDIEPPAKRSRPRRRAQQSTEEESPPETAETEVSPAETEGDPFVPPSPLVSGQRAPLWHSADDGHVANGRPQYLYVMAFLARAVLYRASAD